jgi:hypothetical protein
LALGFATNSNFGIWPFHREFKFVFWFVLIVCTGTGVRLRKFGFLSCIRVRALTALRCGLVFGVSVVKVEKTKAERSSSNG